MKKLRDNGLSLAVFSLFLLFWGAQTLTGWHDYNNEEALKHQPTLSLRDYVGTGHFFEATFENWESEFLQMGAYVILTSFLFQRGSAESKDPDKPEPVDQDPEECKDEPDAPGPVKRGGWQLAIYRQSLSLAFLVLFLFSFVGHAIGGFHDYRDELAEQGHPGLAFGEFLTSAHFWFQSFQNWQSEFLAVFSIVILSIWLRQQGSSQSKPVAAPHSATGD